jgi:hypothetical protein
MHLLFFILAEIVVEKKLKEKLDKLVNWFFVEIILTKTRVYF